MFDNLTVLLFYYEMFLPSISAAIAQSRRARITGEYRSLQSYIKRRTSDFSVAENVCRLETSIMNSARTVTTYFYLILNGIEAQQPIARLVRDIRTGRIIEVVSFQGRASFFYTRDFTRNYSDQR